MLELTTIELFKGNLDFAAGHFTIFSATRREKLHGHTFRVYAALNAEIQDDLGMAFDYGIYKEILRNVCKQLDGYFLLPSQSPYLKIEEDGDYYQAYFHTERIPFLKKDIILLPMRNVSVEELSKWFVEQLSTDHAKIQEHRIHGITIKIFSGPGQGAAATWKRS